MGEAHFFSAVHLLLSFSTGIFETAVKFSGTTAVNWKRARKLGSSQQGKIRRASVASNCVPSMIFFAPVPCS